MTLPTEQNQFTDEKILVASHNPGKVREIQDLLRPFDVVAVSAAKLGLEEPEETGRTFTENALIKAYAAAKKCGFPALSDDSGLCVEALDGDPGIYSARWAGPERDFDLAMTKVHAELEKLGTDNRRAYFVCALCLVWPEGKAETFEGRVYGTLTWPPKGDKGFGYDPIFVPEGCDITFGEMEPEKKHAMSHRARAFGQLIDACFKEFK